MEISHRSKEFIEVAEAEQDFRDLLKIPANYKVLFCHGGARAQFAAIPGNLLGDASRADYIDGGYWAHSAIKEAENSARRTPLISKPPVRVNAHCYRCVNGSSAMMLLMCILPE